VTGGAAVSGGCLGPGLRPPDPDGLGPGTPGLAGRPPVSTRTEGAVDHAVRREEPLGLPGCLEPLHPPLSSPARPMRVLRAIAEVAAQLSGELRAELSAPAPEALRRAGDASPREDQFDIPQAQAEHRRQPDRVADALRRDAVSRRGGGVWCDPVSFAQPAPSSYCHSTGQCLRKMSMVSARRIMA